MKLIPPIELIVENKIGTNDKTKIAEEFADLGEKMAKGLISQGQVKPTSSVLDVGSGLGRITRGFVDYIDEGTYTGIDIVGTSVEWCQTAYKDYPQFRFIHADIFSKFYNPEATTQPENYRFPFPDASFDFVFSMSLFTHLLQAAAENYLKEIARVLKPERRTVNTFFLLDDVTSQRTRVSIPHDVPGGRIQSLEAPEHVSALYLDDLKAVHAKHGLEIERIGLGNWSGRPDANAGYQDVIIARKHG
ncbi:MAG: class I SAM-dependent methyltransferase [Rhizobiales bacterium]|nr:class I SAM-dependent methyltransferase [Hyphomicrobiales bacterium]MBI3672888.1 class I SAM-dependent methyltransferase [Hyphomicrobiales bacterium]